MGRFLGVKSGYRGVGIVMVGETDIRDTKRSRIGAPRLYLYT
jgi:hypothetical protein